MKEPVSVAFRVELDRQPPSVVDIADKSMYDIIRAKLLMDINGVDVDISSRANELSAALTVFRNVESLVRCQLTVKPEPINEPVNVIADSSVRGDFDIAASKPCADPVGKYCIHGRAMVDCDICDYIPL